MNVICVVQSKLRWRSTVKAKALIKASARIHDSETGASRGAIEIMP